ncbi:hypothetical protein [Bradyrhizobium sp. ORS 375]|uniref:hypothetical protein n=1 Tax=Bradyrhizobium sp. (strain ORS 375) TaxID=566679 RepID=UPI00054DA804|nr:hypothetical protein [Bradyrhizobium sp. ORS 375]
MAATSQPAGGPWVGAFAYAVNAAPTMRPLTLDQFFAMVINNHQIFQHAGFVFLPQAPAQSSMPAFRASMLTAAGGFPPFGTNATLGGFVLWLQQLDSLAQGLSLPYPAYALKPQSYRLFAAGGRGRTLFFDASAVGSSSPLSYGGDSLVISPAGLAALSFGDAAPSQPAVKLASLSVPLTGQTAGCLSFSGVNAGALTAFDFGFDYAMAQDGGPPSRLPFPLLDSSEALAGATVNGVIDPFGFGNPARNNLAITPAGGSFVSAYRTVWNEKLSLRPGTGAQFVAAAAVDPVQPARLYFAPSGDFAMTVPGATQAAHRLVCGFATTEQIGFADGDLMRFMPGTPADIAVTTATNGSLTFGPGPNNGHTTALAAVVKSGATPPYNVYYSESANSPLFSPGAGTAQDPRLLRHDGFALRALPPNLPVGAAFPLLPYGAVTPTPGFAAQTGALAAFEYGYLATTRAQVIRELPAQSADLGDPRKIAVTPQGYIVGLDGKGNIVSVELGAAAGCQLTFQALGADRAPTGQPLPENIRDAFLAPQQFIVISAATADYIANCTVTLAMSGWGFSFAPASPDKIAPGDYQSVLIIKSAQGRVSDLASTPAAWTGYQQFNVAALDPTGAVLSGWLSSYIANAKAQYNNGLGLAGLQTFCELVDDPEWNGFLCLNVPVAAGQLDPSLSFLLAGVDPSALVAHHVGCAVNHTVYDGSSYAPDSAFFGLVHYLSPGTSPNGSPGSGFIATSAVYDFQLLALETLFENSALKSFSSSAAVILNALFGDAVLGAPSGPGPIATDLIIIRGALQQNDGAPSYVFATAPGATSTFYLSSSAIDRIEIDRALVAQNADVDQTSSVTFQMSGWMGTLPPASGDFDLLSYAAVSFVNFGLTMSYDSNRSPTPGGHKSFRRDLSGFTLSGLPDKLFTGSFVDTSSAAANTLYRPDSFAASFPLQLKGFVIGADSKSPADLGYRELTTNPSTGGASPSGEWYGLAFDLPLGGSGSLDASGLINAQLMFTWTAGGTGVAAYAPFIRLSGPGGVNLSFDLEGILRFGADGIMLSRIAQGQQSVYVFTFASVGVTVFTRSFPPKGSTNILVAGFGDRTLGWFGAYVDPKAPPLAPTQAVTGGH